MHSTDVAHLVLKMEGRAWEKQAMDILMDFCGQLARQGLKPRLKAHYRCKGEGAMTG